ncbi:MAG: energy-coupled thiamine transporter ThiT [Clostridia bacterium]|nr:energy-coupled thiamine transporter ThiT [Clostridia bacterium]
MFAKFAKILPSVWGLLAALAVIGVVLYCMKGSRTKWTARMLANAAISIALASVLSYIRLYKMPQGGSITLASMLPIFMFAYAYGVGPGLFVGLAYGFVQWMQDGFWMLTPVEGVMDYLLAFAVMGLAGLCRKMPKQYALPVGCIVGALARAIVAITAGVIFFAENAPVGQSAIVYSMGYNGLYLIPDTAICVVLAFIPQIRDLAHKLSLNR